MSWEISVVLCSAMASGVAAFGFWLRFKRGEQSSAMSELQRRLDRLEGEVRNAPRGIAPVQLPPRMGAR